MKNAYFNKLRESDRTYDLEWFDGPTGKKLVKKRSHKRSRKQVKEDNKKQVEDMEDIS